MVNGGDYVLNYDDNMLKLAKMQETLLKVTANNRQENLEKYKNKFWVVIIYKYIVTIIKNKTEKFRGEKI